MKSPGKDFCGDLLDEQQARARELPDRGDVPAQRELHDPDPVRGRRRHTRPDLHRPAFFELTELAPRRTCTSPTGPTGPYSSTAAWSRRTEPVFYNLSDVWNRPPNAAGAFDGNNRPLNELPQNGPGSWPELRVRAHPPARTGTAVSVSAHFLVSAVRHRQQLHERRRDPGPGPQPRRRRRRHRDADWLRGSFRRRAPRTCASRSRSPRRRTRSSRRASSAARRMADDRPAGHQRQQQGAAEHGDRPGPDARVHDDLGAVHNGATVRRDIVLAWNRSGREAVEDDSLRPAGGRAQVLRGEGRLVVSGLKPGESRFVRIRPRRGRRQSDAPSRSTRSWEGTGS